MIPAELYEDIKRFMPIPCVDVVAVGKDRRIVLLKRANEPAQGQWWFPGGRVLHGELRAEAVKRKIMEECGLTVEQAAEMATIDVLIPTIDGSLSHGVTTVFVAYLSEAGDLTTDRQSDEARWFTLDEALGLDLHPFVEAVVCSPVVLEILEVDA